ncbi:MAG: FAD-dependent oxidoreductase [Roseateles asaccharophilus]|uniref:FAD-dependent oxidoreductase n=1 Tax=Roseateles asaccharophilus TaxID=582607 RepID=UPI00391AA629
MSGAGHPDRLLLLGGGHSHALTLLDWVRRPLASAGLEIVLLSPNRYSLYSGLVPAWMAGRIPQEALQIDLAALCRAAGARLLIGEAQALDPAQQRLQLSSGECLGYRLLSVNTGSTLRAPEHAGPCLSLRPLARLLQDWPLFLHAWQQGRGPMGLDAVGGGAAGVEVLLAALQRLHRLRPDRPVQARLFSASERLLMGHPAGAARRAEAALRRAGVQLMLGRRWQPGDSPAQHGLLWAAGAQPPEWLARSGLALSAEGYLAVEATLQSRSQATVFAAGDSAALAPALDKSGVRAVRMASTLAHNLRAAWRGEALQVHRPQSAVLALLALPDGSAIASHARWGSAQGRWVGRWKDALDHAFMNRFTPEALASLAPQGAS